MKELKFRNLTKDEIEVRVGAGSTLLLYKTARVDANALDEKVGAFNWQKKFYQVKNTMICSVGINVNYDDPSKEPLWVWKDDAGDESATEAIKGEASDSFKRAGFAWGIGRSLYTAPKIKLPDEFKNSKFFDVELIEYNSKNEITHLVITTNFGKDIVYQYPRQKNVAPVAQKAHQNADEDYGEAITQETKEKITEITGKYDMGKFANFKSWLSKNFGTTNIGDLTETQGKQVVKALGGK